MKLKIVILFSFIFLYTLVLTQEIRITSPNGGELWEIRSVQYVQWDATDTSNGFKITLLKNGVSLGAIGTVGPGERSFRWEEVGRHQYGAATAGSGYSIKVKEQRTDISDESDATFTLTDPPPCDLQITDIFTDQIGNLKATVKNQEAAFEGLVMFETQHPNLGGTGSSPVIIRLSLGANSSRDFTVCQAGRGLFRGISCGTFVKVIVDPHDSVIETNNTNNTLRKKVFRYPTHDGQISGIGLGSRNREIINVEEVYIEPADCGSQIGDNVKIVLRTTLSNCGATNLVNGTLKVTQYYKFEEKSTGADPPRVRERRVSLTSFHIPTLEPGHNRADQFDVILRRKLEDWVCRRNTLIFEFLCGESGPMAANNKKKIRLKFRGF
jgi:hypothetical protein